MLTILKGAREHIEKTQVGSTTDVIAGSVLSVLNEVARLHPWLFVVLLVLTIFIFAVGLVRDAGGWWC